jgi:hypothetical protein
MYNDGLLENMVESFGIRDTVVFCAMVSAMYEDLHRDLSFHNVAIFSEYDYEREWWNKKYEQLTKIIKI